jgi:hypothetical protein
MQRPNRLLPGSRRHPGLIAMSFLGLSVLVAMAAPAVPVGADPGTACLTSGVPYTHLGACASGSPSIVGFVLGQQTSALAVTSTGTVFDDQGTIPGMNGQPLVAPITGIADYQGIYWLVARDGGIFAFGDGAFHGSLGGQFLNAPMVGIVATHDGKGYWLVAADGGIFAFGDASFYGSMGGQQLNSPIVGMAATFDGKGYRLVASDGGVFAFGDASFYGSMAGQRLNAPVVGMGSTPAGYFLAGADGGIFSFGDATFESSGAGYLDSPVIGVEVIDNQVDPFSPPHYAPFVATASGDLVFL